MVTVTIRDEQRQVEPGTTYEEIAADFQREYGDMIALVSVDGRIVQSYSLRCRMMWDIRPMRGQQSCCC